MKCRLLLCAALLSALAILSCAQPELGTQSAERAALTALYNAADGKNWRNNENWLSGKPLGEWFGVFTDVGGNVVELNLGANGLDGELPPEFGNLADLEALNLAYNELSGEIPPEFGNLTNLARLYLSSNELSGKLPPELGNLEKLKSLFIGNNNLIGEMPPELGRLTNLKMLSLQGNELSGACRRKQRSDSGCLC